MTPPPSTELPPQIVRLKRRADFLRAAKGPRWHGKAMSVQRSPRPEGAAVRVGFTLTRKVGCAVVRNRARRRLREAVRLAEGLQVEAGHDYVIIGRIEAIRLPFAELRRELDRAVRAASGDAPANAPRPRPRQPRSRQPRPAP